MKKLLVSLAVCSALGLAGCDDETLSDAQNSAENSPEVTTAAARVLFDPGADEPVVQVPNDLLYQGTTDGTLNIPVDDPTDSSDPFFALSTLDGWSIDQPFPIEVGLEGDLGVDEASVTQAGTVRIYEAIYGGPLAPEACAEVPAGAACQVIAELEWGVDFTTVLSGNRIVVMPLKPLKAKTGYLLTVTNQLMDSLNRQAKGSTTYESVKQDITTHPVSPDPTASSYALQALINSFENAVEAFGVDPAPIIYSAAVTTQSTVDVMATNRLSMIQDLQTTQATTPVLDLPMATGLTAGDALAMQGIVLDPTTAAIADTALYYTSTLRNLPYYLTYPSYVPGDDDLTTCDVVELGTTGQCDALNSWWKAAGDSPVTILGAVASGALTPEMVLAACPTADLTNAATLVGCQIPVGVDGDGNPIYLDQERNLTKFNPLAAPTALQSVPVLVTIPATDAMSNAVREGAGLPAIDAMPAGGWPVAIFSHGFGQVKENALGLAGSLALQGIAVVALDHPLHGERSWDANMDGVYEISASEGLKGLDPRFANANILAYAKLDHLLTVRDNLRQSANDQLALRMGINVLALGMAQAMMPPMLDPTQVHMTGQSLGGITSTTASAVAGLPLVDPTTGEEITAVSYKFATTGLNVPAQALAGVFAYSDTFGPVVEAALTTSGAFIETLSDVSGLTSEELAELEANDPEAYQALVDSVYPSFLNNFVFAAQTIIDAGDPVAHTPVLATQETPVYLAEALGDEVLPNSNAAVGLPLSGTEPMIAVMQLPSIDETTTGSAVDGAVRFIGVDSEGNGATHGSLLNSSSSPAATAEMQTQLATYFASQGAMILVSNPDVVAPAE